MFFKTRMRRVLRRILAAARAEGGDPVSLPPTAAYLEGQAAARGLSWRGLSPAEAALLIAHEARLAMGAGSAGAARLERAARREAEARGLGPFWATLEHEAWRAAREAALRRDGHPPASAAFAVL
ncbi:hypothetical protein FHS88_001531 [Roseomonas alkaliterrae]|uniref:Uncharacterized protein n=2 Tax=Neoroseomonas alkaliterrae TaxID=1452450 RepID=A0A840XNC1_9PROT|nr:hypothetical protein [Neoroseomonas alkaliterrae]MBB5689406.1 hypothetical protein [Neoroseomonas alkaliterrae]